jgi:hypothetical protein
LNEAFWNVWFFPALAAAAVGLHAERLGFAVIAGLDGVADPPRQIGSTMLVARSNGGI